MRPVKRDTPVPSRRPSSAVAIAIGAAQVLAWGSSYYLLAVLAAPVSQSLQRSYSSVIAGLSLGLIVAAGISLSLGAIIVSKTRF